MTAGLGPHLSVLGTVWQKQTAEAFFWPGRGGVCIRNNEGQAVAPPAKVGVPQKSITYKRGWRGETIATYLTTVSMPRVDEGRGGTRPGGGVPDKSHQSRLSCFTASTVTKQPYRKQLRGKGCLFQLIMPHCSPSSWGNQGRDFKQLVTSQQQSRAEIMGWSQAHSLTSFCST